MALHDHGGGIGSQIYLIPTEVLSTTKLHFFFQSFITIQFLILSNKDKSTVFLVPKKEVKEQKIQVTSNSNNTKLILNWRPNDCWSTET